MALKDTINKLLGKSSTPAPAPSSSVVVPTSSVLPTSSSTTTSSSPLTSGTSSSPLTSKGSSTSSSGTYNPSTGVYTDPSGQGYSTAFPPAGATIVSPSKSSGGSSGKSGSGSSTTPQPQLPPSLTPTTPQTTAQQLLQSQKPQSPLTQQYYQQQYQTPTYQTPQAPQSSVLLRNTYDPTTFTYTDYSGQKYSMASAPAGAVIINGKSSISQIPKTTPAPTPVLTTPTQRSGVREAVKYFKESKYESLGDRAKGAVQIGVAGVKSARDKKKEDVYERYKAEQFLDTNIFREDIDAETAKKIHKGELELIRYTDKEKEEYIKDYSKGDKFAGRYLLEKVEEEITNEVNELSEKLYEEDMNKYASKFDEVQERVNKNEVDADIGNNILNDYAKELDTKRNELIETRTNEIIKKEQKVFDNLTKKHRTSRLVLTTSTALLASVGIGVAAGSIATATRVAIGPVAQATGFMATSIPLVSATGFVAKQLPTSKTKLLDVAEVAVPLTAFIAGGAISSKIGSKKLNAKQTSELNSAISRASLELKDIPKEVSSISQLKIYKLSPEVEASLMGKIGGGKSIRMSEYKIVGSNTADTNLINKHIPYRKIEFAEVVDVSGKVIQRIQIGKIEFGKTITAPTYSESILSVGSGRVGESGVGFIESIGLKIPKVKGRGIELSKDIEIFKSKSKIKPSDEGLFRGVSSDSYLFEGKKIVKKPRDLLSLKDISKVTSLKGYTKMPVSKSRVDTLQIGTKLSEKDFGMSVERMGKEKGIFFRERDIKFKTLSSKIKVEDIPKPIEFRLSKKMKPFTDIKDLKMDIAKAELVKAKPKSKNEIVDDTLKSKYKSPIDLKSKISKSDIGSLGISPISRFVKTSMQSQTKNLVDIKSNLVRTTPKFFATGVKEYPSVTFEAPYTTITPTKLSGFELMNLNVLAPTPLTKSKTKIGTGLRIKEIPSPTVISTLTPLEIPKIKVAQQYPQRFSATQLQRVIQMQRMAQSKVSSPATIRLRNVNIPKLKSVSIPPLFNSTPKEIKPKIKKSVDGDEEFLAITKRRGKEVVLGITKTAKEAEMIAKRDVLGRLSATVKVKTTKGKQIALSPTPLFRQSKTDPLSLVQLETARLGSLGERKEIQMARRIK